jgi:glycosyltransferase involved in cell wall biosynthesis
MQVMMWPAGMSRQLENPYASLLSQALNEAGILVVEFRSWMVVRLKNEARIWHIHWPDSLLREGVGIIRVSRVCGFLGMLVIWRLRGRAIVWTIHNVKPHAHAPVLLQLLLYYVVTRTVTATTTLSEAAEIQSRRRWPVLKKVPNVCMRHGLYKTRLVEKSLARAELKRKYEVNTDLPLIAHIGQLEPYKGIEDLRSVAGPEYSLIIGGRVKSAKYLEQLKTQFATSPNCTFLPRFMSQDDVSLIYSAADLAVFPYRSILQSGSALLALSHNLPVILPRTAVFEELAAEAGPGWVSLRTSGKSLQQSVADALAAETNDMHLFWDPRWDWRSIALRLKALYSTFAAENVERAH